MAEQLSIDSISARHSTKTYKRLHIANMVTDYLKRLSQSVQRDDKALRERERALVKLDAWIMIQLLTHKTKCHPDPRENILDLSIVEAEAYGDHRCRCGSKKRCARLDSNHHLVAPLCIDTHPSQHLLSTCLLSETKQGTQEGYM